MNDNPKRAPKRHWWRLLITASVLLGAAAAFVFVLQNRSDGRPPETTEPEAVAVRAAAAVQKTVPVQLTAIGTVESYASVSIKSRISGQLVQVHFKEGQDVSKGDLLFTIDRRRSAGNKRTSRCVPGIRSQGNGNKRSRISSSPKTTSGRWNSRLVRR